MCTHYDSFNACGAGSYICQDGSSVRAGQFLTRSRAHSGSTAFVGTTVRVVHLRQDGGAPGHGQCSKDPRDRLNHATHLPVPANRQNNSSADKHRTRDQHPLQPSTVPGTSTINNSSAMRHRTRNQHHYSYGQCQQDLHQDLHQHHTAHV